MFNISLLLSFIHKRNKTYTVYFYMNNFLFTRIYNKSGKILDPDKEHDLKERIFLEYKRELLKIDASQDIPIYELSFSMNKNVKEKRKQFPFVEISFEKNDLFIANQEYGPLIETKYLKEPYINLKSFRIESFTNYFENLYKEKHIISQKYLKTIVDLIANNIPNVI